MKVEALIFNLITLFCFAAALVYGFWAREPVGTTALALSGALTLLIGGFFWFVGRRIDPRPEDRKDAEIADGAGEVGFFSPSSYWPFTLACSAAWMGLSLAFYYVWMIVVGGVALIISVGGLLFEYYVGQNAHS